MNLATRVINKIFKRSVDNDRVNLAAANNLFGSIATSPTMTGNYGFIPIDGKGNTISLTGDGLDNGAQWLTLSTKNMQWWAYNYCAPLAAVIDRLAEADTNGRICFIDENRVKIKNVNKNPRLSRIKKLLKNPNPLQTWEEFNSEQIVLCKIFGYCPVYAICPFGMDKSYSKALYNLNPFFCQPMLNEDFDMTDLDTIGTIKNWQLTIFGKSYTIENQDILLVKDGYLNNTSGNFGLPISKIAGLDYFVSNICAAMEADNVLLKKKGPLGIFSYDQKPDIAGFIPMTPEEKNDLQSDLDRYGLTHSQLQFIISKTPVKWNSVSFNLRDLMTKETVRQGVDSICDRFAYPAELMSGKNATYENRDSAEKYCYQNNVIPFSIRRMSSYDDFFGLNETEASLNLDYNHLVVLQDDIMKAGQASEAQSNALTLDWKNGIITFNEYRVRKTLDTVEWGNIYYQEYLKKFNITENGTTS